jgi:CheY-like chemotaxis protein/two-component sensor histidine kinase
MYTDLRKGPRDARASSLVGRLEEIERAGDRASSLTRQLLTFSRKDVTKLETLQLRQVVAGMESMLRRLIGAHIELEMELDPETPWIRADAGQIEQVVMNLALNARDAMEGGGKLWIRTCPDGPEADRRAQLTVRDTGVGMEPEVQGRIFEPFFTTKPVGKGTGLGLSTTYGIVKSVGGEIELESAPGAGTSFTVWLPATSEEPTAPEPADGEEPAPSKEVVLVCEDDRSVRDVTCEILRDSGYQVLEADSARAAEDLVSKLDRHLDLLITDVVMPEVNGHELARRLTARLEDLRVLLISGYSAPPDSRGLGERRLEFLQKPFAPSALLRRVRQILD